MTEQAQPPSESATELGRLLSEESPEAEAISLRFHRTMLWKLRTGKRLPELKTAVELEQLSGGRIKVAGWIALEEDSAEAHESGEHTAVAKNEAS